MTSNPHQINPPRAVEFRSIKQLLNRMNASRDNERSKLISVEERDIPPWQRQLVWTDEGMGLLAYSIIRAYPIGMMILWKRPNGIRVPIDGRQRLTAIREFAEGRVAIPALHGIPDEFKGAKYALLKGDEDRGFKLLDLTHREAFDDYEPHIVQYDEIEERSAMDIFVKLQGGKSLTKAELRAALGGKLCDFVTELTSKATVGTDESLEEEAEVKSSHPFFQRLKLKNIRKAHRTVADVLLHEHFFPGQDKHWTSLEEMYVEKSDTFAAADQADFRRVLGQFERAVEFEEGGEKRVLPQLGTAYFILSCFRAWREVVDEYAAPKGPWFREIVEEFETKRQANSGEVPWVNFTAALSNAGYARNKIGDRHDILMAFILRKHPELVPKDSTRRLFSRSQKMAIWSRAGHQCEWADAGVRCEKRFADFERADADHFWKWSEGGPTTVENGRLLCREHNRARR